ncbi:hypothetical protein BU17DRAFT_68547 [Hysterangium stoloniferum]|nr:hypothetical protein BU17DRAFT_68547 [Hysterangium stoloniferum]
MQTDDRDREESGPGPGPGQKTKSKPRLVACRECHRSKLKCDRTYPCKSCIKTDRHTIIPTAALIYVPMVPALTNHSPVAYLTQHASGTLVATKRQKSAIEASQLREKTATMAERIRALEGALATAHAKTSNETHPLLVNTDVEDRIDRDMGSGGDSDVIDAFGTLSIGQDGRSKYHNQSAGADYFAEAESPDVPTAGALAFPPDASYLPSSIMQLAALFPFGPAENDDSPCKKADLVEHLPTAEEAWRISGIFFEHGEWLFDAVSRTEFTQEIFPVIYIPDPDLDLDPGPNPSDLDGSHPHQQPYPHFDNHSPYNPQFTHVRFPENAAFTTAALSSLNTFPPRSTPSQPFPAAISQPSSASAAQSQFPAYNQPPTFPGQHAPQSSSNAAPFPAPHATMTSSTELSHLIPSPSPPLATLSLFFIMLALGTLLDTSVPYDIRATEPWYQLARAAFCLGEGNGGGGGGGGHGGVEGGARGCMESLHFQIIYLYMTDRQTVEHRWLNMGLLAKLTYSTGLHRDNSPWIRDNPQEIERRRKLFWEIYAYDAWISFIMGRPPSFNLTHIQCPLPREQSPYVNENGIAESSFHTIWKYTYRTQCLVSVVEEAFGAKSPSYATILKLDRKIRDFEIPASLQPVGGSRGTGGVVVDGMGMNSMNMNMGMGIGAGMRVGLGLEMQRYMLFCERETSLLYLHRTFFAQAVCDCPDNPLESKYATSVSATYRRTHDATVRHPELAARFWFFWSNLFSAAIVLGSIVTRSPACQLSASAMTELDLACNLMEHRAAPGRSAKAVPILRRLRDKAHNALTQLSQGGGPMDKSSPSSNNSTSTKDEEHDELAIYAGRTRFISASARSRSPTSSPQGVNARIASPRRRGSESGGPPNIRMRGRGGGGGDRRGSEPFGTVTSVGGSAGGAGAGAGAGVGAGGYADMQLQESEVFRQAHPALLEYMKGIHGYVPPPAILRSILAAREEVKDGGGSSPSASPHGNGSGSTNANGNGNGSAGASGGGGGSGVQQHSPQQQPQQPYTWPDASTGYTSQVFDPQAGGGGMYLPGMFPNPQAAMAQAAGTFVYPAELNGDRTWQQLMAQLGVMDGGP